VVLTLIEVHVLLRDGRVDADRGHNACHLALAHSSVEIYYFLLAHHVGPNFTHFCNTSI